MPMDKTVTDLDALAQHTAELGQRSRTRVVPKIPVLHEHGSQAVCALTPGQVTGVSFLDLALHAEARIVYADFDILDADEELKEAAEGGIPQFTAQDMRRWAALQRRIRDLHGRCAAAELGFVDGTVLLTWSDESAWSRELGQQVEDLWAPYEPADEPVPNTKSTLDGLPAFQRPSREMVARHAAHLAGVAEFRSAGQSAERRRVAECAIPELADENRNGVNYLGHLVVQEAGFLVEDARKKTFAQMTADMPALARRLTDEGVLQGASGQRSRVRRVREALQVWSGGYRPSTELAEDVEAFIRRSATGQQMTMA
ncbi:hypothetical protein [Streptomyces venezuelae]|uniref:hypothetical protein n=1 Tax=Streptomyces venezuelae TaxID=54571 RepID=UPI00341300E2